jgi:hypothetical protein
MSLGGKTNKLHCPEHVKNTSSLPHLPGVQDKLQVSQEKPKTIPEKCFVTLFTKFHDCYSLPNN